MFLANRRARDVRWFAKRCGPTPSLPRPACGRGEGRGEEVMISPVKSELMARGRKPPHSSSEALGAVRASWLPQSHVPEAMGAVRGYAQPSFPTFSKVAQPTHAF